MSDTAKYFQNAFNHYYPKNLIKQYTDAIAEELPGSSGKETLKQMVTRFYIDFEDTLAQDKNIDKHTALLNIEFSSILLKNLFQLLFEKVENYQTPLDKGNPFAILEQDLSFSTREQFINIIKNNRKDYDNAALFYGVGRAHSFKETSRWLQLSNKKYNPEITLLFNYISHEIAKNLVTGVISGNERSESKNRELYGLNDNSGNVNLYFYNLVQKQLGIAKVAVSGTSDVNKMRMGKFLKSLDNLLTGKPDNLEYAKELGFKNFSANKEYLPIDFSEYQNQKNELYDKDNISSEKKISKTKTEINTIIFCAVFFVIGIIIYNILTN